MKEVDDGATEEKDAGEEGSDEGSEEKTAFLP